MPAAASTQGCPPVSARASQTAPAAFSPSPIIVPRPAQGPAARAAFVPPVRPLYSRRKSLPVDRRTSSRPVGIDPST
jgi:hypothetical protein